MPKVRCTEEKGAHQIAKQDDENLLLSHLVRYLANHVRRVDQEQGSCHTQLRRRAHKLDQPQSLVTESVQETSNNEWNAHQHASLLQDLPRLAIWNDNYAHTAE